MAVDRADPPQTRLECHFGDRVVRCMVQRPADVNAMFAQSVARDPQGEAVVCGERRLSWEQFHERVMRLAGGLFKREVRSGHRVALLLGNDVEFVLAVFAVSAVGAITVPLSVREQTPGLAYILRHSGASVVVLDADLAPRLPASSETPELRLRVAVGGSAGAETFDAVANGPALKSAVPVREEDVAVIMYTSGTTGFPKGAMLTHLNIVHSVLHYAQALSLSEVDRGGVVVPLSHVTGLVGLVMVMVGAGGTLLIAPAFKARDFLAFAQAERMSFTIMVPAMYNLCLLQEDFDGYDLSGWRVGGFGGAPMPTATIDVLAVKLPRLALSNCYGATETASPASIMPPQHTRGHLDSVGLALPCAEIAVMDDDGRELPRGEIGELWLKGPMVVKGYWNNPEATADAFVGAFWRSGDIGRMDVEGFVYVMDRRKDMLNRGGYKIFSVEVENVLCQHPGVLEAAVVAKSCPVLGERVHVFVVAKSGWTPDERELITFCSARLSDYKVPESYTFSTELLPRNANGKLLKRELRSRLQAQLGI